MFVIDKYLLGKMKDYSNACEYSHTSRTVNSGEYSIEEMKQDIVDRLERISKGAFNYYDMMALLIATPIKNISEYYIYKPEEVMEILYPSNIGSNKILHSAFSWISSQMKAEWVVSSPLAEKKRSSAISVINNTYIASSVPFNSSI